MPLKKFSQKISWIEPLIFAKNIAANHQGQDWIFLYSALNESIKNSYSYIAIFPNKKISSGNFLKTKKTIESSNEKWFGYLSYEVGAEFEKTVKTKNSAIILPKIYLVNFAVIFEFNHEKKILKAIFDDKKKLQEALRIKDLKAEEELKNSTVVKKISSNFTNKSYLNAISDIKEMIGSGDFYQTNLTRKFFGEFEKKQNQQSAFYLFSELAKSSPGNYMAFMKLDKNFVLSSSPELFIKIEKGQILSRPIKGTAPRASSASEDLKNKNALKNSPKERAENLMIVDLVRNDLARICKAGSVKVDRLFDITSYKTIHHMSSEVSGQLDKKFSNLDALQACFPPGSMTGAPKIKAMEVAAKKEKIDRGIYSGCIGFFDGKKSTNLSVVIRTLIIQEKKFEFQAGGAITFDSSPEAELAEVFNKTKAITRLLNIKNE